MPGILISNRYRMPASDCFWLFLFFSHMFFPVAVGCLAYILIKSSIERLAIGEAYHGTDFLHIPVGIAFVRQQVHGLSHPIFVQQTLVIHTKA